MGQFKFTKTPIEDLYVIEPKVLVILEDILWKHIIMKILKPLD